MSVYKKMDEDEFSIYKEMGTEELRVYIQWMANIDTNDPHMSAFNFDPEEYVNKFIELINEDKIRRLK